MAKLTNVKVVNENTVEYNGFVYEFTEEKATLHDLVQCFEDRYYLTTGEFYMVHRLDDEGDMGFEDDEGDTVYRYADDRDFKVFRKSHAITLTDAEGVVTITLPDGTKLEGTPSDLEKITRSMQALQAEQVATVETVEVEDEPLKVGDYAKVIKSRQDEYVGLIVELTKKWDFEERFNVTPIIKSDMASCYIENMVKATDEEVQMAMREAKQALLKEGGFARVISNEATTEKAGAHKFEIGTVVKLKKGTWDDDVFKAYYLDESDWWNVHHKDLEPLTSEETEHIAREAEEEKKAKAERAKWAAIGREVGEIKDGDVVKVIGKGSSDHKIGDIGEVSESSKRFDGQYSFRVTTESLTLVNWLGSENVELIVPVEQRFDKAE